VFSHPDVEQLELQGYRVISGLLDIYEPLLKLSLAPARDILRHHAKAYLPPPHKPTDVGSKVSGTTSKQ
jgi:dGTPase